MNYRRIVNIATLMIIVSMMAVSPVLAAKPDGSNGTKDVIAKSNGFPSGEHFNLNIHGKKAGYACNETPGGGSVFVDEYGPATIQYVTNKKSSVADLTVLDPCAVNNGTAKVQLPYEADGYLVFGRILGKPNHGESANASSVILYPNVVIQACNDTAYNTSAFANLTSCDDPLLALGFILHNQVYLAQNETYVRFDPLVTKGKGKSKATDITALFTYVGWVVHPDLDIYPDGDPDGVMDDCDVPGNCGTAGNATAIVIATGKNVTDYDCDPDWGNCNGTIDLAEEWLAFQADLDPPMAWYYGPEDCMWIFNIADLVVTEQGLVNDGAKLLQIRFYPKDGTTFE